MKKILLFTALVASCLSLNADLLNGPYSAESQELVKLVQNPTMPIPKKFKKKAKEPSVYTREEEINALRREFDPNSKVGVFGFLPTYYKDNVFNEAFIQLLLENKPKDKFPAQRGFPADELYKYIIATIALQIKDFNLLREILKNSSLELKNLLLADVIQFAGELAYQDDVSIKNNESIYQSSNLIEDSKQKIKSLINLGAQINGNITMNGRSSPVIAFYHLPIDYSLIVFLIDQGFNINTAQQDPFYQSTHTLLDRYQKNIIPDTLFYSTYEKHISTIQKIIDYLRSKGAKTYTELTATQKGQK